MSIGVLWHPGDSNIIASAPNTRLLSNDYENDTDKITTRFPRAQWFNDPPRVMMTSSNGNIFHVTGPLCGEFYRSPVNSPHKGQWRGALMFLWSAPWINGWVNNRKACDLRRYRAHYDVIVMGGAKLASMHYGIATPCDIKFFLPIHHPAIKIASACWGCKELSKSFLRKAVSFIHKTECILAHMLGN